MHFLESLRGKTMTLRIGEFKDMARVFHSLGNKTRLRIMTLLTGGEMNVTTICKKLRLPQTSVSEQLRLLRIGGLVVNRREGNCIFYSHADLSKHRLARKSELSGPGSNAARFGPVELTFLTK